jgi:antirestriction protein ArdC
VAGFNTWKSLGRFVRKGEKGIRIIAPIISRKKESQSVASVLGESQNGDRLLRGFRFVHVFAQERTDGDELPSFRSSEVEGDVTVHFARLVQYVAGLGITLEYADDMDAQGLSYGGRIVLKSGMSAAETFSVLVHETGHELMHKFERRKETTKTVRETEAEAVAFVVCSALGLATNGAAADYISLYSGDAELLMASLALIQLTASGILKAITDKTEVESGDAVQESEFALPAAA